MEATRSIMIISTERIDIDKNDSPEEYAKKIKETMEEIGMKDCCVSVVDAPLAFGGEVRKGVCGFGSMEGNCETGSNG